MTNKLSFENLPEAIQQLQSDVSELRELIASNPNQPRANRLMILPEAAELLHLSKPTIYRLVGERGIPFHKQGGKLRFIESELIEWATERR